ncbi:MAG: 50S ribosomal protein L2 [Patescibacteria group bacterium]|nr:50S ribosomal protein L2 [Patescibacteria group bacterium]MDE1945663.1 50S ribosomal protein L2 [Patescibacteria group bacterium]
MKTHRPTSPSRRHMTFVTYRGVLTTDTPYKALTKGKKANAGRNNRGRITMRHQGSGHKQAYRFVDFNYDKHDIPAKVVTVEYDPYRTGFIGLVNYADGEKRYVLLPKGVKVGDTLLTSEKAELKAGNRTLLKNIPVGTFVYNIEIKVGGGAKLVRSAGSFAQVVANDAGYVHIKMPSSEVRKIPENAWASVGSVSNDENWLVNVGKAGRSRWMGIRPTVRGSVMNPMDHPYGGGEGKQPRGTRYAKTKWGKHVGKGQKSRTPKKYSNYLIVSRRKVGKQKEGK